MREKKRNCHEIQHLTGLCEAAPVMISENNTVLQICLTLTYVIQKWMTFSLCVCVHGDGRARD